MKKNRLFVLGIITMFVAILSLTLVSGTMARYTSTVTGSDSVKVAKWDVTVNTVSGKATEQEFGFNLFDTIVDTVDGAADDDVKTGVIAPGTKGEFTFTVKNSSEVNAEMDITFTYDLKNVPLVIKLQKDEDTAQTLANVTNQAIDMNTTITYKVTWEWAYGEDSASDTQLGIDEPTI